MSVGRCLGEQNRGKRLLASSVAMRWRAFRRCTTAETTAGGSPVEGFGGLLLRVDRISLSEASSSSVSVILAELES